MGSFQGKKNVYLCPDCGHGFVSEDVDDGTTPFMTWCLHCGKMAVSMMYKIPQGLLGKAAVKWIRPPEAEWDKHSPAVQEHLRQGGLIRSDSPKKQKRRFRV